jgi:hypothetical protein
MMMNGQSGWTKPGGNPRYAFILLVVQSFCSIVEGKFCLIRQFHWFFQYLFENIFTKLDTSWVSAIIYIYCKDYDSGLAIYSNWYNSTTQKLKSCSIVGFITTDTIKLLKTKNK